LNKAIVFSILTLAIMGLFLSQDAQAGGTTECPPGEIFDPVLDRCVPIVLQAVGGIIIPIETTALLLAGAQTSAIWMAPLLFAVAGAATIYIKKKRN
jgi:hypothetical protein